MTEKTKTPKAPKTAKTSKGVQIFSTRSFSGAVKRTFLVETEVPENKPLLVRTPSHHILCIDRSGSMYSDMEELKSMVLKLLTLNEFNDSTLKVSLISYSSQGDCKLHFKGVTVGDIMRTGSHYQNEIKSLRATAMTCISQSLVLAETIIDDNEITCISLHTDGFANDASPTAESRAIQSAIQKLKVHPRVFANTIAYRSYCDYNLLAGIANELSGSCIQAKGLTQVYEALHGTTEKLRGGVAPALSLPLKGAKYMVFVSNSARKVLGSETDGVIQGLSESDDKTVYRFYESNLDAPAKVEDWTLPAIFAYARARLGEGKVNESKYALMATQDAARIKGHSRALVSSDIAEYAESLELAVFDGKLNKPSGTFGMGATGPSLLAVMAILDRYNGTVEVNREFLAAGYKRQGLRKVPGTREKDGTVVLPLVESKYRNSDGWADVQSFDLSRSSANINMLVTALIDLYNIGEETRIEEIAGVNLKDLKSYNNYTIVGDGTLNVNALLLRTSDKRVFKALSDIGAVEGTYKPGNPFTLDLSEMSLVDYEADFKAITPDDVRDLARATVRKKILDGAKKGTSESLTAEQIAELKKVYLTSALNFSPPTMNEFADLEHAKSIGKVDTRLSYKIEIGIPELTSMSKLKSGNDFLQRRFATAGVEKPTLDLFTKSAWVEKPIGPKLKLEAVDDISFPVYKEAITQLQGATEETIQEKSKENNEYVENIYEKIRSLVFYIGATGLVPDSLNATAMSGEQLMTKYPEAKLSKAELADGTFFVLPNGLVITVYVESKPFSVT